MIKVYVDGLCEPKNPGGIATFGFIVFEDAAFLHADAAVIGEGKGISNNVAEYTALLEALKWLRNTNRYSEGMVFLSDSKLLVNQMRGEWQCHGGMYTSTYTECLREIKHFKDARFLWIPREQNSEADALSRKAYEEYCKNRKIEIRYHDSKKRQPKYPEPTLGDVRQTRIEEYRRTQKNKHVR